MDNAAQIVISIKRKTSGLQAHHATSFGKQIYPLSGIRWSTPDLRQTNNYIKAHVSREDLESVHWHQISHQ
uniref:Uncharacterized protein n=1 Tax=Daphnia magna TaxID=35525 RepID=A0A0P6DHR7_9CRUS